MPIIDSKFNVVFCLEGKDLKNAGKSNNYIQNAIEIVKGDLDKLEIFGKIHLNSIGQDIIKTEEEAHDYRNKYDIDLIIWGKVFSGGKEKQDVCDFNKIYFTYKSPSPKTNANLAKLFRNDVNVALVKRDWHIYEINSIPDIINIRSL